MSTSKKGIKSGNPKKISNTNGNGKSHKSTESTKYIFLTKIEKGHLIKVLIDLFSGPLERVTFIVDTKGIRISETDQTSTILFDVIIAADDTEKFICRKPINFSFNLKDAQKIFKSIKKKDKITLFIEQNSNKFYSIIEPENDGSKQRCEMCYITFKEEIIKTPINLPTLDYSKPYHLKSADFQKVRKLISGRKKIHIKQVSNDVEGKFLSFESESEDIIGSCLYFGDKDDIEEDDIVYEKDFHSTMINNLIKIPGLTQQILFSTPSDSTKNFLLITFKMCQSNSLLGKVSICLKTIEQIDYEQTIRENNLQTGTVQQVIQESIEDEKPSSVLISAETNSNSNSNGKTRIKKTNLTKNNLKRNKNNKRSDD
jgi:hypothetical protein